MMRARPDGERTRHAITGCTQTASTRPIMISRSVLGLSARHNLSIPIRRTVDAIIAGFGGKRSATEIRSESVRGAARVPLMREQLSASGQIPARPVRPGLQPQAYRSDMATVQPPTWVFARG